MDRSLDEVISERQRGGRGRRGPGRNNGPRDGVRKSSSKDTYRDLDRDWVHDRFDDTDDGRPNQRNARGRRHERFSPEPSSGRSDGAKLRVDNLHYELSEEDLEGLFNRIGPVKSLSILYDRAGRSEGTAFVTYGSSGDARRAIREFDGANANGQPIRLTLLPSAPTVRNPFDTAIKPGRSLFDRVQNPRSARSLSPGRIRRSDVSKPPPDNIDRYVPGQRTRSPRGPRGGRRPGARREENRRNGPRGTREGEPRPKKTQEELDAEMEDYWGQGEKQEDVTGGANGNASGAAETGNDDIEMIE